VVRDNGNQRDDQGRDSGSWILDSGFCVGDWLQPDP